MRLRAYVLALVLAAASIQAVAQEEQDHELSYATQLSELSHILGRAHYLRIKCNGRGDARWRTFVRNMISREEEYRAEITASFNDGYREEEARFPYCDQGAVQMEQELRAQGLRLAQGLSVRNAGEVRGGADHEEDDE